MRLHKFLPLIVALVLFALAAFTGCNGTGNAGVIASVEVYDVGPNVRPAALARYDGNTLCVWGGAAVQYSLFLAQPPNIPLYGPFQAGSGKVFTAQHSPTSKSWTTDINAPLPWQARVLFREGEITVWGLTFTDPADDPLP